MQKMFGTRLLIAVISMGLLLFTACTSVDTATPATDETATDGETAAQTGGSLSVSIYGDIDNFDPHWNQLIVYEAMIGNTIFESLVSLDENMAIQPALAESWEQTDDVTWVFNLRQDVTFHDGSEFTAADVIYSYERTVDQQMTFATKLASIESMEALDEYTLQLTLTAPWAPLLDDLYAVAIVPEGAGDELSQEPIGTGPFRFVEWVPNDHITLEKNADYWNSEQPKLDELVIRILPDALVARANLQSGDIDAVYDMPIADAQSVKDDPSVVWQTPPASGSVFLFELGIANHEALQDVNVRRALAHALDKATIQRNVYFGEGEIIWSPLPQFSWAYAAQEGYPFDLEQAGALLEEAGYGDGLELDIEVISGVKVMEDIATIWQANLAEIGVTLNINTSELNIWLDKYVNQEYDIIANWFNVSSDPNSVFDIIYKPLLASVYDNAEMSELIEAGATATDQAERQEIYAQLQQMTVDNVAPILVVQTQPILALTSPAVQDWKLTGKDTVLFGDVYIAE